MCEKLAKALDHLTNSEDRELFDFGKRAGEASPLVSMDSLPTLSRTAFGAAES